jgi:hypothetical protein
LDGDPRQVARQYMDLNIDHVILAGYPHLEGKPTASTNWFFPGCRSGTKSPALAPPRPFGETIGNLFRPGIAQAAR